MGTTHKRKPVSLAGPAHGRQTSGRYSSVATSVVPGALPPEGRDGKQLIMHGAVDDPNSAAADIRRASGDKRQRVAINAYHDALEFEHAHGRISPAAYNAGLAYQLIRERASGNASGGGQWNSGDRVDQAIAIDKAILSKLQNAAHCQAMLREVLPIIGQNGEAVLCLLLGHERLTIKQAALRLSGRAVREAVYFWAETFRRSCELLANQWASAECH